ncbi:MAG: lytic transglycosylase domain-containing protein [Brevundimonas sp.]|nr:lytic transglycosylase domain-containing protein [Brevundimonas sp.]
MIRRYRFGMVVMALVATNVPAYADVLEIGAGGATWIAGGPVAELASDRQTVGAALVGIASQPSETAGPAQWRSHVARLAQIYDLSPHLLEARVWQESRWRPGAVSPAGARGLTQLMPGTARDLGVNPNDPIANLEGGARYLRQQLDTFGGDVEKALAAYNAGPNRVIRAGGIPRIRETQGYVAAIMARLAQPVRR